MKTQKGIKYLNKYNLNLIFRFWFLGGYKSVIAWILVFVATGTYGIRGGLVVLFLAMFTIIIKGFYKKLWKPYALENLNKDEAK